jgi:hypothetical protein
MAVFPLNDEIRTSPACVPDRHRIAGGATEDAAATLKSRVNGSKTELMVMKAGLTGLNATIADHALLTTKVWISTGQ